MAVTLDSLCGVQTIRTTCQLYLIASGVSAGTVEFSIGPPSGPDSFSLGDVVPNAGGTAILQITAVIPTTWNVYLHQPPTSSTATRIAGPYQVDWVSSSTIASCPTYITAAPFPTASPADSQVGLSWSAATKCDSRGTFSYTVRHSAGAPPSLATIDASALTATSYTVAPLTNGTPYSFRVDAAWGFIGLSSFSTVVTATPFASSMGEQWGAIAV